MRDKASEFRLIENAPIMHGQTDIILKNVKTGLVERIRSENTFQGSKIARYLNSLGDNNMEWYKKDEFMENPWKYLVGGLFLFQNAIAEGEEFMPAGNKMIGKGSNGVENSSAPTELGTYNSVESSASANGITQVWDFTTSQANGQISCVCLTSKEGGLIGYGNPSGQTYATLSQFGMALNIILGNNQSRNAAKGILADKYRYTFYFDTGILTVKEYKTNAIVGSVFAGLANTYTFDMDALGFPNPYLRSGFVSACYVGNGKIRFAAPYEYMIAPGDDAYYGEFDCTNHTVTAKHFTNSSQRTIGLPTNTGSYYNPPAFTTDNKIFAHSRISGAMSENRPLMFDLGTSILEWDATQIYTDFNLNPNMVVYNPVSGLYFINAGEQIFAYDNQNHTLYPMDSSGMSTSYGYQPCYAEGGCVQLNIKSVNTTSLLIHNPLYLATINNLDSAVTKTAAQTMKVTYTLTEV